MGSHCRNKILSVKNGISDDTISSSSSGYGSPSITSGKNRRSQYIINIPAEQLRKFGNTDGMNSISKETQQFVGITTVHGPLRVYRGHGKYRLLWLMAMIICSGVCIWQVMSLIQTYVQKVTNSRVSFILPEGMELPLVTVCNYNNVRQSYVKSLNDSANGKFPEGLLEYMKTSYLEPHLIMAIAKNSIATLKEGEEVMKNFTTEYDPEFNVNRFFLDGGPICEDTFKICAFAGTVFDCCSNMEEVMTDMGKCFRIDVSKVKGLHTSKQIQSGVSNGLQIFADSHEEEQTEPVEEDIILPMEKTKKYIPQERAFSSDAYAIFAQSLETGFRVYIHPRHEVPLMSSEGVTVSPGTRVYSAISPTRYQLLPEEFWGKCTIQWPDQLNYKGEYSSTRCVSLCRAQYYNERCGCAPFVYNIDQKYNVCSAYEVYSCIESIQNATGSHTLPTPSCSFCKVECDRWAYHTFNSYGQGFSRGALEWIKRQFVNETDPHIKSNYVTFNVYYRDMAYTNYEEVQSTTLTQTVSNVGGTCGVFLGISFISLIEIVVYLWKMTWAVISKNRRDYLVQKTKQEEQREKTLEMTLKNISSRSNIEEQEEEPKTFRRIAHSIRQKVTANFPRRNSINPALINDSYLDQKLHGTGKANFGKPNFARQPKSDFVELRLDPNQLIELLKEARNVKPNGKPRSSSCPRPPDSPSWLNSVMSIATLPVKKPEVDRSLEQDYLDSPQIRNSRGSVIDDESEPSSPFSKPDQPDNDDGPSFY